jgi:hypothetical protein
MKKLVFLGVASALIPFLSFAHEGHGHTHGFTITHYFVETEHLAVLLCVFAVGILYFGRRRKKIPKGY